MGRTRETEEHGSGEERVVFIHGAGSSARGWQHIWSLLMTLIKKPFCCERCGHKMYITRKLLGVEPKVKVPRETVGKLALLGVLASFRVKQAWERWPARANSPRDARYSI